MMIVFDVETTGFIKDNAPLKDQPEVIEFAAIKLAGGLKEVDRMDFLVSASIPLPAKITEITGITDKDLEGLCPFSEHYQDVEDFFGGATVCMAHNLRFDKSIIDLENQRMGPIGAFPWPEHLGCTMLKTQHLFGKWQKLEALYQHAMGHPMANAHRAMSDVDATVDIIKWMVKEGLL